MLTDSVIHATSSTPVSPSVTSAVSGGIPRTVQGRGSIDREMNSGCWLLTRVGHRSSTGVGTVQIGNRVDGLAVEVCLEAEGPFKENGYMTRVEVADDEFGPVFSDETSFKV